jgi:hypothetical protein
LPGLKLGGLAPLVAAALSAVNCALARSSLSHRRSQA